MTERKNLTIRFTADTRHFRRGLILSELRLTRSRWKRLRLRLDLCRVDRELRR